MRRRGKDEDEARRRFDAVWPGASERPESTVDAWRRFDEKPGAAPDGVGGRSRPPGPDAWPPGPDTLSPGPDGPPGPEAWPPDEWSPEALPPGGSGTGSGESGDDPGGSGPALDGAGVDLGGSGLALDGAGADLDGSGLAVGGPVAGSDAGSPRSGGAGRRVDRESARAVLGAFDPGRRGLRGLVVVGIVVALVAAYLAWRAQPHAEPVQAPPSATRAPGTGLPSPAASVIVVAVQGKVAHPGLVRLPAGSRVADAIAAAGGALPGVDLSLVNLARKVSDGELVVIGLPQADPAAGDPAQGSGGGDPANGVKVNLNTASLTELESLPGIGPALAQHIVDYRTQHGGFHAVEDLRQVSGIGDTKFAAVKDLVTV